MRCPGSCKLPRLDQPVRTDASRVEPEVAMSTRRSGVTVRRMVAGDEDLVRGVCTIFDRPLDEGALRRFLASPSDHLLVAYVGGQPGGYAIAHELPRLDGPRPKLLLYRPLPVVPRSP